MSTIATATEFAAAQANGFIIPCDDRCMFATGEDCDCQCQGANHQRGEMLTAVQRTYYRTRAGRRVNLLQPGTADFALAISFANQENAGSTRKAIAREAGVSQPVVRRLITRLNLTLEALDEHEAAHAHTA